MGPVLLKARKSLLRNQLRRVLRAIPVSSRKKKSEKIVGRVLRSSFFRKAQNLMIYISFGAEVETHGLVMKALSLSKKVFIPCVDSKRRVLKAVRLHQWKGLTKGPYGILEPRDKDSKVRPQSLDLVVVPGLAFTRRGDRLGRGAGYFDRFLKRVPKADKVGLAFREQIRRSIPTGPRDVRLDRVIMD